MKYASGIVAMASLVLVLAMGAGTDDLEDDPLELTMPRVSSLW